MPFILKRIILYFYIEICISCIRPYFSFKLLLSGNNNIHLTYVLGIKRGWIYTMLLIVMTTAKTCHINCQKWMQRTFVYKLYSIIQLLKHDNKNNNLFILESQIWFNEMRNNFEMNCLLLGDDDKWRVYI